MATTGIAQICERAGVTKGVFAHHFPQGKDDLTVAVIASNSEQVRRGLLRAASVRSVRSRSEPAVVVKRLFATYAAAMETRGSDFGCPVAAAVVDASWVSPSVRAASRSAFMSWRDDLEPVLGVDLADIVVATLEGAILVARAEADPGALRRIGQRMSTLVEHATTIATTTTTTTTAAGPDA